MPAKGKSFLYSSNSKYGSPRIVVVNGEQERKLITHQNMHLEAAAANCHNSCYLLLVTLLPLSERLVSSYYFCYLIFAFNFPCQRIQLTKLHSIPKTTKFVSFLF